jgi:hypothetical protein
MAAILAGFSPKGRFWRRIYQRERGLDPWNVKKHYSSLFV